MNDAPAQGDRHLGMVLAGKYRLIELIGTGGIGRVYRADHLALDAQVAVKLLSPEVAADEGSAKRFHREARMASRLRHPNVVQTIDFGRAHTGELFLVMELLRGHTLADILEQERTLQPRRILTLLGQALDALDEAHAVGLIHRDLKPENIFVETARDGRERVKVLDFGVAKLGGREDTGVTARGTVCGTPDYMAPEQVNGREIDGRADLYALGVVLYELLCGDLPFRGDMMEVLMAHLTRPPPPPSVRNPEAGVFAPLEAVCLRALAKSPDARYATAAEMKRALEQAFDEAGVERCQSCGARASVIARFCAECGAELRPSAVRTEARSEGTTHRSGLYVEDAAHETEELLPSDLIPEDDGPPREERITDVQLPRVQAQGAEREFDEDQPTDVRGHQPVAARPRPVEGPAAEPAPPPVALERVELPFVGRKELLEQVARQVGPVLLVGAPGVGKTALANEWARREAHGGRRVLKTRPDPSGAGRPWFPVRALVGALLGVGEHPDRDDLDFATRRHVEDRPGLAELFGVVGTASVLPSDIRRRECLAATLETLRREAVSYVFDDVDRYDAPSRELLGQLFTQPGQARLLATSTRVEVFARRLDPVRIGPLSDEEVAALKLPEAVTAAAGGVPFQLEMALRALKEGARAATVEARLDALAPDARKLAEAAAIAGSEVPIPLLAQIVGVSDPPLSVAQLSERGWLRADATGLELATPSLRWQVYAAVTADRRQMLHWQLAALLAGAGGDPIIVAHHSLLAADLSSVGRLERAGDIARNAFDDDAATHWYQGALEFGKRAPAVSQTGERSDPRAPIRIALKLALVLRYRGELHPSAEVLRDALELARARGDGWAEVQALRGLAYLSSAWEDLEGAREHLIAGIHTAVLAGDGELIASLYLDLADVLRRLGKIEPAARELTQGLNLCTGGDGAQAENGPESLWRMLVMLGELTLLAGRPEEALAHARDALRLADRAPGPLSTARAHALLADALLALGHTDEAARHKRNAAAELRRAGDRRSTAETLIGLALTAGVPPKEARQALLEAESLARQMGWHEGVTRTRAAMARLGT